MDGISTLLARLTAKDDLEGIFQGYPHAIFMTTGPWLLAVFWLAGTYLITTPYVGQNDILLFRQVLFYNFSFSMVLSAPVLIIVNRYLGDLLLTRKAARAPDLFLGALAVLVLTQLPLAGLYYGWVTGLHGLFRIAACINYFVLVTLWLLLVYLSALRAYRLTAWVFFAGMLCSLYFSVFFTQRGSISGMITGFSSGLLLIVFTLLAYVLSEYRQRQSPPLAFLHYLRRYWSLALAGLGYFLVLWVDKWVMWTAPDRRFAIPNMPTHRDYETVMLVAMLTALPTLLMFIVHLETNFSAKYLRFYRTIRDHAPYDGIRRDHKELMRTALRMARTIGVLQACITLAALGTAGAVFAEIGLNARLVPLFRIGVLGAMLQAFAALPLILLLLFDFRRTACVLTLSYAALSGLLTYLFLPGGTALQGYGFTLASAVFFVTTTAVLVHRLRRLPYYTFVVNNEAVSRE